MAGRDTYMRPRDWDRKFTLTAKGKKQIKKYPYGKTRITRYFTKLGFATLVLHWINRGDTNRQISKKVGDSIRVARAITYLLRYEYII